MPHRRYKERELCKNRQRVLVPSLKLDYILITPPIIWNNTMKTKRTLYLAGLSILALQHYPALAYSPNITVKHQNNLVIISNHSDKPFDLSHASIQFDYAGKLINIQNFQNGQAIPFSSRISAPNYKNIIYAATLSRKNEKLFPKQSLKLALITDNLTNPENFKVTAAPAPVNVTIKTYNSAWQEIITICNTSGKSIPLHNLELNFNYSVPMPTTIWGEPWANWKLASQTGNQVVLIGGTDTTPDLPSDPNCMRPLTVKFTASPTTPEPVGPFVFKAETGTTPPPPPPPTQNACPFDSTKECILKKDILNDISPEGLRYYAPTNYDHRAQGGEQSVFDAALVTPYSDDVNVPGQISLTAQRVNSVLFKGGEIMTRMNLHLPPFNSPVKSVPFSTKELTHGYIEIAAKMPKCDVSDDGLCQSNLAPEDYSRGLYPYVWLLPTNDAVWPANGEIDILEGYHKIYNFKQTLSRLHFEGTSGDCDESDCKSKIHGFLYPPAVTAEPIYNGFHTWGFEWEPDPNSTKGGALLSTYFDNVQILESIRTDYFPSDGPKAIQRGFNDPAGGFYIIAALAVGGPFVGEPNSHLQKATMKIQSIRAYAVQGASITDPAPSETCFPPRDISYKLAPDKKSVTFFFNEISHEGDPLTSIEVYDYQRVGIWESEDPNVKSFVDTSIANVPGPGRYPYYVYGYCKSGTSYKSYRKTVTVD